MFFHKEQQPRAIAESRSHSKDTVLGNLPGVVFEWKKIHIKGNEKKSVVTSGEKSEGDFWPHEKRKALHIDHHKFHLKEPTQSWERLKNIYMWSSNKRVWWVERKKEERRIWGWKALCTGFPGAGLEGGTFGWGGDSSVPTPCVPVTGIPSRTRSVRYTLCVTSPWWILTTYSICIYPPRIHSCFSVTTKTSVFFLPLTCC